MPKFLKKRFYSYHMGALFAILFLFVITIFFYHVPLGIAALIGSIVVAIFIVQRELTLRRELLTYVTTLSERVADVSEEALREIPIGILLYDDEYRVEWANKQMETWFGEHVYYGKDLASLSEKIVTDIHDEQIEQSELTIANRTFHIYMKKSERVLYFFDETEHVEVKKRYEQEKVVFAIVYLDNYDEITQGMSDAERSALNSEVTDMLNRWALEQGIYLKRSSSEKFFAVLDRQGLHELEETKFSLLDDVREFTSGLNVPITLSIGVGSGTTNLQQLAHLAQSGLDLALGRGGDQVAIKQMDGKVRFYGGKTNPVEKRTRVRARVISHALRELVLDSDKVFIMGHRQPDMDALGAAIGVLKVAQVNEKEGYIIFGEDESNFGIMKLMEKVKEDAELWSRFIRPDVALDMVTSRSLLIVVDTHKPSLVIDERLIHKSERTVVIDHHRRGEDFIEEPVLVYMEPYASSTSELVTELLEYQPEQLKLTMLEATALLAGITVDTKNFTLRTGSRTFDAASYLRARGADTILVQHFLSEDLSKFMERAKLVESAVMYREGIAIAKGDPKAHYEQVLIAQAADTLLSFHDVKAAFVISRRPDGMISISARSLGSINVQVMMEALGGGGHLTNAAVQLEAESIAVIEQQLKQVIDDYFHDQEGGDK